MLSDDTESVKIICTEAVRLLKMGADVARTSSDYQIISSSSYVDKSLYLYLFIFNLFISYFEIEKELLV